MPLPEVSNETIFITGFPGFIATRLIRRLAIMTTARFQILVQSAFLSQAQDGVRRIAAECGRAADDFHIVTGDITAAAHLGMNDADADVVRRNAKIVYHLAALYDLGVAREPAMRVNVEGTAHVNAFVRSFAQLRHYHYVSTCYVAGKRTGRIRETELVHGAGFRNFYEETKYLAEVEVERLKRDVPITIHRPSVVCGDSHTGETAKYDGIYYLIKYLLKNPSVLTLANIGNAAVRLNIVPIDFVVAGLTALHGDERVIGETLQLADPAPLTTAELFEAISRALTKRGSLVRLPPSLVRTTLDIPFTEIITGMPRVAVPYFFIEQEYDTTLATQALHRHEIACPRFDSYVGNLIDYVVSRS